MKYLFLGSIGKDNSEADLDERYKCLVEIVLLIQASSVSIFWRWDSDSLPSSHSSPSHEAKKAVAPLLSQYPYLIEYCATKEDGEMSRLPHPCKVNRKCEDTKRILLESVPSAGIVGVPIPLGYGMYNTGEVQHGNAIANDSLLIIHFGQMVSHLMQQLILI
jgi:hypothetical protein